MDPRNPIYGHARQYYDPRPGGPQPKLRQRIPRFRYIVPEGATTDAAKLQQAWENLDTGEVEWETVETVVVSEDDFRKA